MKRLKDKPWYTLAVALCLAVILFVLLTHWNGFWGRVKTFLGCFSPVILGAVIAYIVNPLSLVLSGEMLLRHAGFSEAADLVLHSVEKSFSNGKVTRDFHTLMQKEGRPSTCVGTREFGKILIANL